MSNVVDLSIMYIANPTIGRPISNGDIYVGVVDLDPKDVLNQKQISVLQENGTTVQVTQPISTSAGGVPLYNGSPVTILVDGPYSMRVDDSTGAQIYYVPSASTVVDTVEYDHNEDGSHIVYGSIAELRASTLTPFDGQIVSVAGYSDDTEKEDWRFQWASTSSTTDNNGTIIKVTAITTGRWLRLYKSGIVWAEWFGADGTDGLVDDLPAFQAAMDTLTIGGTLRYGPGDFFLNGVLTYGRGIRMQGVGSIGSPENYSSNIPVSTLRFAGIGLNSLRCYYNGCSLVDTMVLDNDKTNTTIGLDLRPGPDIATISEQTSSYFLLDNVVIQGFYIGVNGESMSGNDGGWFHRYERFTIACRGAGVAGSIALISNSNSGVIKDGQLRGAEHGFEMTGSKFYGQLEISGCAVGWYSDNGKYSNLTISAEANTQNLAYNDSAINKSNHINLLFADNILNTSDKPTAQGNTLSFNGITYNAAITSSTSYFAGTLLVSNAGGTPQIIRNLTNGLVISITSPSTGLYELTMKEAVNFYSVQATIMQSSNIRVVIADNVAIRNAGTSDLITLVVREYNTTTLTDLSTSADQGVMLSITVGSGIIYP